ncbi:hypothetical protein OCU04_005846 [Sclerotinia nivalis]|uniref:Uncharacterized protein n=1 Tax=Sclerotinia nivalis TaxID=352851 RepID=A0A9X0DLI3_9HELO|nr:hypothetical protein OCU04_005846 [Sclerotinia nivalis]
MPRYRRFAVNKYPVKKGHDEELVLSYVLRTSKTQKHGKGSCNCAGSSIIIYGLSTIGFFYLWDILIVYNHSHSSPRDVECYNPVPTLIDLTQYYYTILHPGISREFKDEIYILCYIRNRSISIPKVIHS